MCIQAHTGSVRVPHHKHLVYLAALYPPVPELTCRLISSGALNLHTMFPNLLCKNPSVCVFANLLTATEIQPLHFAQCCTHQELRCTTSNQGSVIYI